MIKINPLDAHDRLISFQKQGFSISECCQDMINKRPFGNYPFYIWAHSRTDEDGATKRLIWQPRLTKPSAQTNSMLFKAYPGTDLIKIIWMIPARELWGQYQKGKITQNETVWQSIFDFCNNRDELNKSESDDLSDSEILTIYRELNQQDRQDKMMEKLYKRQQDG
jgi:hypothetical protein